MVNRQCWRIGCRIKCGGAVLVGRGEEGTGMDRQSSLIAVAELSVGEHARAYGVEHVVSVLRRLQDRDQMLQERMYLQNRNSAVEQQISVEQQIM